MTHSFPTRRSSDLPTTIFGVGSGIDLVEISSPIDCIGDNAGAVLKCPTFVEHEPMDHRHGHEIFEPFQGTHDQRPMRPRASHGNVEVVSVRLRGIRSEEHTSELQSLMRISYA